MGIELSGVKKEKYRLCKTYTFLIPSVAKCGGNYSLPQGSLSTLNEIINRKYMQLLEQWEIRTFGYKKWITKDDKMFTRKSISSFEEI